MRKPRLNDTCSLCDELVWQYTQDDTPFCAAHARWKNIKIERMLTPQDGHHRPHVMPTKLERATKIVADTLERIGPAEAMWVSEHLGFEWGVQWWGEQVHVNLSDLQMVAFAAAMQAHREATYPARPAKDDPKIERGGKNAAREEAPIRRKKKRL